MLRMHTSMFCLSSGISLQIPVEAVVAALVVISMVLSFLFTRIPFLSGISTGMKVIILTVALSALAAYFFPIEEDESIKEAEA